ncbi:CvpA family protein [Alphaproteobacteria bacterium LSUCC0684]
MFEHLSINAVDIVVLITLFLSGVLATFRGATREIMGLAGWIVAIVGARFLQPWTTDLVVESIGNENIAEIVGFIAPFIAIVFFWFLLANIISPGLKKLAFGAMDRPLGFIFGIIRGVVIIAVIYMTALLVTRNEASLPDQVLNSTSIVPTRIVASMMSGIAPDDIRQAMEDTIPEQDIDALRDKVIGTVTDQAGQASDEIGAAAKSATEELLPDEQSIIPGTSQ